VVIRWKITKRSVDALEPGPKPFTKFDADIAGFGVEVRPSGLKVYVLLYRPAPGGRGVAKRRHVIGHHGEITPDQARRLALDARASIRLGEDPSGEKARRRAALRVDELCDAFLSENAAKLKPKSLIAYAGGLEKVRAVRGSTLAEALARSDVAALHASLSVSP
jgi:hypothetical protein